MSNEMFPRLMPIDIKFFGGESPSPQKLTSVFQYLYSAFYLLESFLGNGIGYRVANDQERKMIFNVSNAIGPMGKLYKPTNILISLQSIYRKFSGVNSFTGINIQGTQNPDILHDQHASMSLITDTFMHSYDDNEHSLNVAKTLNIPVDKYLTGTWSFGFEARGKGSVLIRVDENAAWIIDIHKDAADPDITIIGNKLSKHYNRFIVDSYVSHIEIIPDAGETIEFFSMYLVDAVEAYIPPSGGKPYNIGYALGIDNPTYFEVKKPCLNSQVCDKKTCIYCIGNTYDLYTRVVGLSPLGRPVCGGDYASGDKIDDSLVPSNGLKYDPDTNSSLYTIQSPLLMIEKPYLVKFAPYAVHNHLPSGTTIPKNQAVVYDIQAGGGISNPVKYNTPIQSGGRPDIVFINDTNLEFSPSNSRVMVIGGPYGITNLMNDMITMLTETESRTVAVYAD